MLCQNVEDLIFFVSLCYYPHPKPCLFPDLKPIDGHSWFDVNNADCCLHYGTRICEPLIK